jgi:hypothetical protein
VDVSLFFSLFPVLLVSPAQIQKLPKIYSKKLLPTPKGAHEKLIFDLELQKKG